ncbi:MAG: protein-export chaperone SecB [Salinivirgaceae bacterium]|nr:protein-export chaperone SecB [Salinivirgaceae bacterium]MDD4747390.1 protein-export chaperone SecB [Salinivirgaceae bacterium]MDY0280346.1 protein-export chaperone SecB [Salinivirgaceae bacterium]
MQNATKATFKFEGFKILKSHFEMLGSGDYKTFTIKIEPKGTIYENSSSYELELKVFIEEKNTNFKIEVLAVGYFTFEIGSSPEVQHNFLYANAPAILFPYLRAYISSLTTLSGQKSINLPTLNLTNLRPELEKNTITK